MKVATFDYDGLAKEIKGKLLCHAAEIRKHGEAHVKSGIELGRELAAARDLLDSETTFRDWVAAECGFSRRSAYNYLAAFEEFGECATVAQIELGAMYQLAKSSRAKMEALKLAAKGVQVTQAVAKELVAKASEPKPARERPPAPEPAVERCPNCAGTKWIEDDDGKACAKCHHPHGEPADEVDDDRIAAQRSKTVKTAEALLRAFDDLHLLSADKPSHGAAVAMCKDAIQLARSWK